MSRRFSKFTGNRNSTLIPLSKPRRLTRGQTLAIDASMWTTTLPDDHVRTGRRAARHRLPSVVLVIAVLYTCAAPTIRAQEFDGPAESTFSDVESNSTSSVIIIDSQPIDTPSEATEWPEFMPPESTEGAITYPAPGDEEIFSGTFDAGPEWGGTVICDGHPCGAAGIAIAGPYGRLVGPSDEYLCDGGDFFTPAGVRADWGVEGLEQEDAIAHYDTLDGRVVVVPSNRVCIYAPRFAAVRRVVNLMAHEQPVFINEMREDLVPVGAAETQPVASSLQRNSVAINRGERPATLFRQRQQAGELEQLYATMDIYQSVGAYAALEILRTGQVNNAEKPRLERAVVAAITWTGDQAPQVIFNSKRAQEMAGLRQVGIIYQTDEPNRPRLRLLKLASRGHALPGEEVEFTLRFDNIGDQVMGNVTIVDNLSTRLEYIAGSAQSSVDANFTTKPNDAGSTILRWEITNPVKPREGGLLRFRTKVR